MNGDQGCEGKCIDEYFIMDGNEDCDDGSDEKGMWKFKIFARLICILRIDLNGTL